MGHEPTPFRLHIPEAALEDLRARLARTRFPDEPPLEPWHTGTSLAYLKDLVGYWRSGFEWRAQERSLNGFRQFTVPLGGIELHFIHEPGRGRDPIPLLLSHGWPGSIVEFRRLIPLLTERFTVVAPSLPGYTLSFRPGQKRFAVEEIADLFAALMSDVLGYRRFAAQGGDWGAFVSSVLGWRHPQKLLGIHLNLLAVRRDPKISPENEPEAAYLAELARWLKEDMGYQWIQGTRPQTLAYGLTDSPENAVSRDDLLTNISLYWFTGAIGSSFWPYYARMHAEWPIPQGRTVDVPVGYAEFPREILRPPRSLAARTYTDIRRWSSMPRGGHFAALEQPDALAREILEFFSALQ